MRTIGFMTANYVAREVNYTGKSLSEWSRLHQATSDAFHGPKFAAKFEELLSAIKDIGFDAIELWTAHFDPLLVTRKMIDKANQLLEQYKMGVVSYTAGFGRAGMTREESLRIFEVAKAIGTPVLASGFHPANGPIVRELAEQYNIRMGLENHPEKTPKEVIEKVVPFYPWVGSAIDTGWFATQGYDAVQAVYELKDVLVHVHLKDIKAVGDHVTCALGDGVVDIKGVLKVLKKIEYVGSLSIEHEPHDYDPTEEARISLNRVNQWISELN